MREQRSDTPGPDTVRSLRREQGQRADANRSLRRGERGEERRQELVRALRGAGRPILGSELAQQFSVSRQVLVQDMAILRAAGVDIIATPRGYLLRDEAPVAHRDVLQVQHDADAMVDEMTILVDLGIRIVDISIDHPIYGHLQADLQITSRQDIQELIARFEETGALGLFILTNGRHSHTVESPRADLLDKARAALSERGYLIA